MVIFGDTVIDEVVLPVDHTYETPPLAVNVALNPSQIVSPTTVITGTGFTVTVLTIELEHPPGFPVTVYDVVVDGVIVVALVTAPVDHK